jgi:glycosyltransferase involved in cell wall biosynthesis
LNEHGQTVCLNMIVRNEAPVIGRCLASVRPFIDAWAIVDTGSGDGTQAAVRAALADLPGELIERPWVNFAHNRTEALRHADGRADYVLVIDADEVFVADEGFRLPRLTADSYNVEMRYGGYSYLRKQLVRAALPWRYDGVLHEYIVCELAKTEAFLPGVRTEPHRDGARAKDPHTYRRDALLLENALIDDPGNARYVFYLAQSYRDAGDLELAVRHYTRRMEMGGWPEEVWYSLYQVAQIEESQGKPWGDVMQRYLAAHELKSDRAGPLYRIGLHYQRKSEYRLAHLFLSQAMAIPYPAADRLFVERALYEHQLALEYAVSCFYVNRQDEATEVNNRLLRSPALPAALYEHVVRNRRYSLELRPRLPEPLPEPRVHAVVPVGDGGAALDECIDALAAQDYPRLTVALLDGGRAGDVASRLPPDDARFRIVPDPAAGADAALARYVAAHCAPDDLVVRLRPVDHLAGPGSVRRMADEVRGTGCLVLYGQHRLASGAPGTAEPAPDEASFHAGGPARAGESPLVFRAAVLVASPGDGATVAETVWRRAGLAGTRFIDDVLTHVAAPRPRVAVGPARGAASPEAAAQPLISCLMVTRDRLRLARRAMRCFADQTYANRELVVVSDGGARYRAALERHAAELGVDRVRFVDAPAGAPLARVRNLSLDSAEGDVLCQWDDDDCSHPERLAVQAAEMVRAGAGACLFTDHLQFLESERAVFWIDWTYGGQIEGEQQFFPGSVMVRRDERFRYVEEGPYARAGEDSLFLSQIYRAVPVARLRGTGHLYLYQYHGRNTFSREHHLQVTTASADTALLHERREDIRSALAYYGIPKPVVVVGRDGPAYVLS